jgi:hypothetical protein
MQQAAALFGQGIARRSHVEDHAAIFQDGGLRILGEKVFELTGQLRSRNFRRSEGHYDDDAWLQPRIKGFVLELLPASTLS